MINSNLKASIIGIACLFAACKSDKPLDDVKPEINISTSDNGVFIINEGNMGWGNGSISYYNKSTGEVIEDLYKPVNKQKLGDVVQSMNMANGKIYLMVSNPLKVEVIDPQTFASVATIKGIASPRYMQAISNGKAYITNYKNNFIHIINLTNNTVTDSIVCGYGEFNEQMALAYGKVYVTSPNSNKLYVINTRTNAVEDSILIARGASSIKEDTNGKLWVLCSGNATTNDTAALFRIDPVQNKVEWGKRFQNTSIYPHNLVMNGDHTLLFYIANDGIYKMPVMAAELPQSAIIPRDNRYLYGVGVDPKDGSIYVADASSFIALGVVYHYSKEGALVRMFKVGIGPNSFYFN